MTPNEVSWTKAMVTGYVEAGGDPQEWSFDYGDELDEEYRDLLHRDPAEVGREFRQQELGEMSSWEDE